MDQHSGLFFLSSIYVLLCSLVSLVHGDGYAKTRCFSCNYNPSKYGYHVKSYWRAVQKDAGFTACALMSYSDMDAIDKWKCGSGMCFIRKEKNGFIYRGCADQNNLPFGVTPYTRCNYKDGSLWEFCQGDLCNKGQIKDDKKCGAHKQDDYSASSGYDPCDGKCYGNPSGLFANPYDAGGYIQCGCDFVYGKACQCCRAFYMKCPYGATYDDYTKGCSQKYPVKHQPVYKSVSYYKHQTTYQYDTSYKQPKQSYPQPKHMPSYPQPKHMPSYPQPKHMPSYPQPKHMPSYPQPKHMPSYPQPKHMPSYSKPKHMPSYPQPKPMTYEQPKQVTYVVYPKPMTYEYKEPSYEKPKPQSTSYYHDQPLHDEPAAVSEELEEDEREEFNDDNTARESKDDIELASKYFSARRSKRKFYRSFGY
ncbi:unnamed protein product [Owenia fusiformis]|uniref:Uncharacterized protein n=1 Tax=Owenia fusiformis TaxID=6347 RepID=A0A8J1XJF7_OWEFU|nr:unnamed protein product [Owenia fusiformis]